MGLFAYSNCVVRKKVKEIGIRKVNGADSFEILSLLNVNFITGIGIAFIFASPIAWYFGNKWLNNYAYKTEISWWVFALSGLFALAVALLIVNWQSWNAARKNPVETLRYE